MKLTIDAALTLSLNPVLKGFVELEGSDCRLMLARHIIIETWSALDLYICEVMETLGQSNIVC